MADKIKNIEYDLIPGFYFKVDIQGFENDDSVSFSEVEGIRSIVPTQDVFEGGFNNYIHKLPCNIKYPNLILKRGLISKPEKFLKWCRDAVYNFIFDPRQITISLINEKEELLKGWTFINAYPVRLEVSSFNSIKNELVIETIELAYSESRPVSSSTSSILLISILKSLKASLTI